MASRRRWHRDDQNTRRERHDVALGTGDVTGDGGQGAWERPAKAKLYGVLSHNEAAGVGRKARGMVVDTAHHRAGEAGSRANYGLLRPIGGGFRRSMAWQTWTRWLCYLYRG